MIILETEARKSMLTLPGHLCGWLFINTGLMFAFSQPSEIPPGHHSLSMTPASMQACPMNHGMFSMPKNDP